MFGFDRAELYINDVFTPTYKIRMEKLSKLLITIPSDTGHTFPTIGHHQFNIKAYNSEGLYWEVEFTGDIRSWEQYHDSPWEVEVKIVGFPAQTFY